MRDRLTTAGLVVLVSGCASITQQVPGDNVAEPPGFNRFIAADTDIVGQLEVVTADHEDTLPALARRYDLGYDEITGANPGVDVWLPGEGTRVVLPTRFILPPGPREGIVINVAARRLYYYPDHDPDAVITFPVGIGRDEWETPTGSARVTEKIVNPAWYPPLSIRQEHAERGEPLPAVVPPGPDNPLGQHALLLSMDGYLIHGTNKPAGVGMQVSHGCIRLYPEDIAVVFDRLPVGTPVRIIDQPVLAGWQGERLFMQHYLAEAPSLQQLQQAVSEAGGAVDDWQQRSSAARIEKALAAPRGVAVPLTRAGFSLAGLRSIVPGRRTGPGTVQ